MFLREVIWKEVFATKIEWKHNVSTAEVEQVLLARPYARRADKGKVPGEDVYIAYGQSDDGRYLTVVFVYKPPGGALPVSARDMANRERKHYEQHKKRR
jgi:uncharacterized DUF497 family protein